MKASLIQFPVSKEREMNIEEAAKYLGWEVGTLRNRLSKKCGPRSLKRFGRRFFLKSDLDAFLKHETEVKEAYR